MKLKVWLELFRVPNLASVPGDAIAGAAMSSLCGGGASGWKLAGVVVCALLFYAGGLADNDYVDAEGDASEAPERPIPSGRLTKKQVDIARMACFIAAFLVGSVVCRFGREWSAAAAALLTAIVFYNRFKEKSRIFGYFAMGICRAFSFIAGAAAVAPQAKGDWCFIGLASLAWVAYVGALTYLAVDESSAGPALGKWRYWLGLSVFVGALTYLAAPRELFGVAGLAPLAGMGATFWAWCNAVMPLGEEHTPQIRRIAIGRTIGALIYLQAGFAVVSRNLEYLVAMLVVFSLRHFLRKLAPWVSGS